MARSTARRRALNTLYEADEKNQKILSLLDERIEYPGAQTPLPEYAIEICRGVAEHFGSINHALNAHSTNRTVGRMAAVDRNILRIGAWEILFNDDVPDRVAIDEAANLAGTMSEQNAPSFVTGVLAAISDDKEAILADIAEYNAQREGTGANTADTAETADAVETTPVTATPVGGVAPDAGTRRAAASNHDWSEWNANLDGIDAPTSEELGKDGDDADTDTDTAGESADGADATDADATDTDATDTDADEAAEPTETAETPDTEVQNTDATDTDTQNAETPDAEAGEPVKSEEAMQSPQSEADNPPDPFDDDVQ